VGSTSLKRNRSIPSASVIPVLVYPDVRAAVAWLEAAFGFFERVRIGEDHRSHGARILMEPTDFEYGERQYHAEDLAGHHWTFPETLRGVAPEEWGGTTQAASG
jgi:uncharacterized glyoxalase superfamily protein PhnB